MDENNHIMTLNICIISTLLMAFMEQNNDRKKEVLLRLEIISVTSTSAVDKVWFVVILVKI